LPPMVLQNNVVVGRFEGTPTIVVVVVLAGNAGAEPSLVDVVALVVVVVGPGSDWRVAVVGEAAWVVVGLIVVVVEGATVGA
jgi:hypothetical protein